jgi:hypothetical protein
VKQESCPLEERVAKAVRTSSWPEELEAHAAGCAVCREVTRTAHAMRALAGSVDESDESFHKDEGYAGSQNSRPLPDPGLVWSRARLDHDRERKTGAVLEWVQIGAALAAPIALAGWVAWNWYLIEATADRFLLNAVPYLPTVTYLLAGLVPAALTIAALALAYPLRDSD